MSLQISDTKENLNNIIEKYSIDNARKNKIEVAKVIVMPFPAFSDNSAISYARETDDLIEYLRENLENNDDVMLLVESPNRVLFKSSTLLDLGVFVVREIVLPLWVSLFTNYMINIDKKKNEDTIFRTKIIIEKSKDKNNIYIEFEGKKEEFKEVLDKVKDISV